MQTATPTQALANQRRRDFRKIIASRAVVDRGFIRPKKAHGITGSEQQRVSEAARKARRTAEEQQCIEAIEATRLAAKIRQRELLQQAAGSSHSIRDIQRAVCVAANVDLNEMLSSRRIQEIVQPRQLAYLLCKKLTKKSLPEIGRHFGDRDHTTIIYGIRRVEFIWSELLARMEPDSSLIEWARLAFDLLKELGRDESQYCKQTRKLAWCGRLEAAE